MAETTEKKEEEAVPCVKDYDFAAKVLNAPGVVLVEFFAEWCGNCRHVAPLLEQIARENPGRLQVVRVNVEKEPGLTQEYGISTLPSVLYFRGGAVADRKIGQYTKREILAKLAFLG
ncbi:thiol reductase thioredoxin [Verrucomicrobia bacterium LW23]|nr:thiol reductase thioredoxin [Verrucomicrobia bacterium LW23]